MAISNLSKNGFEAFLKHLLMHDSIFYSARPLSGIDDRIIECPPERYFQNADAFILNYYLASLYQKLFLKNIDMRELEELGATYLINWKNSLWLPAGRTAIYSVNNYDSRALGISAEELLDYYEMKLKRLLPSDVRLRNINTFLQQAEMDNSDIDRIVLGFIKGLNDGLSIFVSEDHISVSYICR